MKQLRSSYIKALEKKYEAQIAEAEANIELYLSTDNLAAIGEHSDILEEQDKWITKLSDAKGKLEIIKKISQENLPLNS